ncbi:hypothetical protein LTR08_006738 [Meristemomyces frigidus]|nr:hypothetical protein LTR08_006738 [Meristemomyces frigidus]
MEKTASLLKPTLHIEVAVKARQLQHVNLQQLRADVETWIRDAFVTVEVGQAVNGYEDAAFGHLVERIDLADYTGPETELFFDVAQNQLDIQAYSLKTDSAKDGRRSIAQASDEGMPQARVLSLPNVALKDEWDSLVFDDHLPARLLRYLTRMVGLMKQPGLNLAAFNWNRLCLLHGPPGSGKSTLCRALAQKLSIRLGDAFDNAMLVEINTNAMLSKYFGESGKLIGAIFERIHAMAHERGSFICVVMDECETIAGSREKSTSGSECNDGMRATNQLLTALDRLRNLPNVIVLCTSNLIGAIDQAFLDRVDIKQLIPCPSAAAIYNIFRSCLNELIRSNVVHVAALQVSASPANKRRAISRAATSGSSSSPFKAVTRSKTPVASSPEAWKMVAAPEVPTFSEMKIRFTDLPSSPGRVWALAQKCEGLSGRTLRRLPILGLAMYTWGGECSLDDAVSALEAAVEQELMTMAVKREDKQTK